MLFSEVNLNRPTFDNLEFKSLSNEEASWISRDLEDWEVDKAVADCDGSKSPGPDGFNFNFVKSNWDILKQDVTDFVRQFWTSGYMPPNFNTAYIALIPKMVGANELQHFRPISMIGCLYKIVSKVLASRLKKVMNSLIGEQQSSFVEGRKIIDSVLIANELIDSCKQKQEKAVIFKVDFQKAFDSVSWKFLLWVLEQMNFPARWRRWIKACVCNASIAILIYGSPTEPFRLHRGLRQGDPLSPLLFNLVVEVLNLLVIKARNLDLLDGISVSSESGPIITHLQFADDTIFFSKANEEHILNIKKLLFSFSLASGLDVNYHKSSLIGINVEDGWLEVMADALMCKKEKLPIRYLGLPLGANMKKLETWQPVIEKFQNALSNWSGKLLSIGGRVTLIKATLANLPIYFLSLFQIPKGVAKEIAKIQRRFLWAGNKEAGCKFLSPINWETIELPKTLGGLGVGNVLARNISLLFKWIWRFEKENEALWRRVIDSKYNTSVSQNLDLLQVPSRGGPWKAICKSVRDNIKAFEIAKEGMRWKVGDGRTVRFWLDPWIDSVPLKTSFPRLFDLATNSQQSINSMGFWDGGEWHWVIQWRRVLFEWEKELENDLLQKLQSVYLNNSKPDESIWSFTSRGDYSCKSFYIEYLKRSITRDIPIVKGIWKGLVPYKIEIFVWLAVLNKIKTKKFLLDRGIIQDPAESLCVFCEAHVEDVNHLFFHCGFARSLWSAWFNYWDLKWSWNETFETNFSAWRSPWKDKKQNKVWISAFFVMIWTIWKARNDRINENQVNLPETIADLFWLRLAWWKKGWDEDFIYSPEEVLRNPKCILWNGPSPTSIPTSSNTWEPPPTRVLKWNVDASQFDTDAGIQLAIGGVLRDHCGIIKCLFSIPITGKGINDAEFMAIIKALELSSLQPQLSQIVVESDSLNAVRWCTDQRRQPWSINFLSNRLMNLLQNVNGVTFQHKSRNSNFLADGLAKLANQKRTSLIAWL